MMSTRLTHLQEKRIVMSRMDYYVQSFVCGYVLKLGATVESEVAARSPQYDTLASGVPAPSLRELGSLTSESGGSGSIGVDCRVTEVTERFGMGLEVTEGFGGYRDGAEVAET